MSGDLQAGGLFLGLVAAALVHALLPTHWLSFVLVARAQRWSRSRMMRVVLFSGLGHVTTTAVVGLTAAALSKGFHRYIGVLQTPLPAFILAGFGLYYLVSGWRRGGHPHCTHDHADDPLDLDRAAQGALFLQMTLSPCETLIPVFLAAGALSWPVLVAMALAMSLLTVGAMGVLAWLAFEGSRRVAFPWIERNERLVLGALLLTLGGATLFLH